MDAADKKKSRKKQCEGRAKVDLAMKQTKLPSENNVNLRNGDWLIVFRKTVYPNTSGFVGLLQALRSVRRLILGMHGRASIAAHQSRVRLCGRDPSGGQLDRGSSFLLDN